MFFVRFIALSFLVFFAWSMGLTPSSELNAFGKIVAFSIILTAPMLYLLPTFEARKNRHANITAIALVNIFLGWLLIGWVIALVWAYKKPESVSSPRQYDDHLPREPEYLKRSKKCPYCAEEILTEAVKCKHCQSDLSKLPS